MDNRKEELFATIDKATNQELSIIFMSVKGVDPFKTNKLVLPSVIRESTIKRIKKMVEDGEITVAKMK